MCVCLSAVRPSLTLALAISQRPLLTVIDVNSLNKTAIPGEEVKRDTFKDYFTGPVAVFRENKSVVSFHFKSEFIEQNVGYRFDFQSAH